MDDPWSLTRRAIAEFDRYMIGHNERFASTSTAMDAGHWFSLRDQQIAKVQRAFYEDNLHRISLQKCRGYSLKQIREKISEANA